jgi:hypothetical protein
VNDGNWTPQPPPPIPSLTISDATVTEGNNGTVAAVFTVTLSEATTIPVRINAGTANGTATEGTDYQGILTSFIVNPGETSKTFNVPVFGDRLGEPNGEAMGVLNLDSQPPDAALQEVKQHPQISSLCVVKLPKAGEMPGWF